MGLMMHAPVAALVDGQWNLVPMMPLPAGVEWKDAIGFDHIEHFEPVSVEESHLMRIWAHSGIALSKINPPIDPNDPTQSLPHGAFIHFKHMPI